jgi:predicted lipase
VRTPPGVLQTYTHLGFQRNRPELCALIQRQVNIKRLKVDLKNSGDGYEALVQKNLELEQRWHEQTSKLCMYLYIQIGYPKMVN